ncbi:MAG: EAL domain-containing protein [Candidatus Sumerlaeota bacterium]
MTELTEETLREIIAEKRIETVFQPIVDLFSGECLGYEVFSHPKADGVNARQMFDLARDAELTCQLDYACREIALKHIAEQTEHSSHRKFFLNVDPHIFQENSFERGHTLSLIRSLKLDQRRVVLEISEAAEVVNYAEFEKMIRHYFDQGFQVALDKFGAGQNGLVTLVAASPNYVKIDRALVDGLHAQGYKQHLVRSIRNFASNVESTVIAEGVENMEDVETLIRLGVRFAQGFALARPRPVLEGLDDKTRDTLRGIFAKYHAPQVTNEHSIINITTMPRAVAEQSMSCADAEKLFHEDPSLDHLVIVSEGFEPQRILTRQQFYVSLGEMQGFDENQSRLVDEIARESALIVNQRMELPDLGRLAMTRSRDDLYDPVVVVDGAGRLLGTITMKQLLFKFINFEVQLAADSNPLTNLPGNRAIDYWLEEALGEPPFSIVYCDLDKFKEFNDAYGFSQGDRMIKMTAEVLKKNVANPAGSEELGHIGGDDFVIISRTLVEDNLLESICRDFDERKAELFSEEDRERGFYYSENRNGERVKVPLVTLSLAVLTSENVQRNVNLEMATQMAASLKKRVKRETDRAGRSAYLRERRIYD